METTAVENPLREGLRIERTAPPCVAVIFGASGDLTRRKLVPALYHLFQQNLLASGFAVLGSARSRMDDETFRRKMREAVAEFSGEVDETLWEDFARGLFYVPSDTEEPESYEKLKSVLQRLDQERNTCGNRLFYLSTPPSLYESIVRLVGDKGLNRPAPGAWTRIIVEKPFGYDLESARRLNRELLQVFDEEQIYRIDHYLGKETVQNIMVLRFANGIFEPLWDRRYVDHVQITAAEDLGVEDRGGYYEQAGALRDMIQNHLFQLFSLVAMEPPVSLEAREVRDEKTKVMRSVRPIPAERLKEFAVRGQYTAGSVGGRKVSGYREEKGVDPESTTETYAALKIYVDNWRWADVPFYLRSGKRLPKRVSEIAIQFRRAPHLIFRQSGGSFDSNALIIRIQPDEGISLRFRAKIPGQAFRIRPVNMDFQYGTSFGTKSPDAYERLLLDAMLGDPTLFTRGDMVELAWQVVLPVLQAWTQNQDPLPQYEAGSWGPKESDAFIEADGRQWRRP